MIRFIIQNLLLISLFSCNGVERNKIDKTASLQLFKEAGDQLMHGIELELTDSATAQIHFHKAINKFNEAYQADPTNAELGLYLPDLYFKTKQYDSALNWSLRHLSKQADANTLSTSENNILIGQCYLYEGDISNAEKYFLNGGNPYSQHPYSLSKTISQIADEFYFQTIPTQVQKLKNRNIDPCNYSLQLMQLASKIDTSNTESLISLQKTITDRQKNCR